MNERDAAERMADEAAQGGAPESDALTREIARLRETLRDLLVMLGDPSGYCEADRVEVEQAVAAIRRALGPATLRPAGAR